MNPTVEAAIALALRAHQGQTDRAGQPYILHPLRLMQQMKTPTEQIVAVLHDVVEDSAVTLADLRADGYDETVLAALDCLTHRSDEPYDDYIERIRHNPLACRVKLADLADNMTLQRLDTITAQDTARLERYLRAWHRLTGAS